MRHIMVPEVGDRQRPNLVSRRWRAEMGGSPLPRPLKGRLNAQKAFVELEPKEVGSEGSRVYHLCMAAKGLPVPLF